MTDIVNRQTRSKMMSGIKSKNTKPEIIVRSLLHCQGFRFRLHDKELPGSPDIVLKRHQAVVFVHGCYWHHHEKCKLASTPKQNAEFWQNKFLKNIQRDNNVYFLLKTQGWRTAVIWECGIRDKKILGNSIRLLTSWIKSENEYIEIPAPYIEIGI